MSIVDDGMRGAFGESPDPFGFDFGLGGVASYLPGQESAFNADVNRQIIDATISGGLANIPQIGTSASPANYLLRNISVEDGIQQNEINAVVTLLDNNLVTIDEVAARTGIPASEIQAVYDQVKGVLVADVLNDPTDPTAGLINLTVGSNQMLSSEALTAAQAAAQEAAQSPEASEAAGAAGGGQTEEFEDLKADTTANDLLTGGLGDVDTGGVADVNETWTYDKATDSFISNTRGDSFPNRGNATLKDGGIYAVTPVLGTDGVTAENVVDTETNESVGLLNIDITTGLPSIIKTVDAGTAVNDTDTFGTAQDTLNTGETLGVGGGNGASTGGQDFETARDTDNTGETLTVNDTTGDGDGESDGDNDEVVDDNDDDDDDTTTIINGANGTDGGDGTDGQDGRDGKDGKDGMIGLFSQVINQTPLTESILFPTNFTKLENVQQGMFEQFLRAAGGRR